MGYGIGLKIPSAEAARIAGEIDTYIGGTGYRNWYAGVASDPRRRLFVEHNVEEHGGRWIFRPCSSDDVAREVEQHFLGKGCQGGPGGGDGGTRYVYAYLVTPSTRE